MREEVGKKVMEGRGGHGGWKENRGGGIKADKGEKKVE